MKKILFEKPFQPFFVTALFAFCFAAFFKYAHPESIFDISIYNSNFIINNSRVWFLMSAYLFLLSSIYYVTGKTKLKTKKWLVVLHYVCISLFLLFFVLLSAFNNRDVQNLVSGIPLSVLISIYASVFVIDAFLFVAGIILLFAGLFSLRRKA